jgi:SAM-dependent methyltransferase
LSEPSPFFLEWLPRLRAAARAGPLVDLACGSGRHALAAARAGLPVLGFDRCRESLRALREAAGAASPRLLGACADLETGRGIPVRPMSCGAILVFRFLFRPLAPALEEALAPGGLLLYETFTTEQRALGHGPANPAFLLRPGELRELFPRLRVLAHWEGTTAGERPQALARLAAQKRGRV